MKANFALSLSLEGIRLLHRASGGWRPVGEVTLDAPDLGAALDVMRETALELEPGGLRTKLVLPDDQIKYMTIPIRDDSIETLTEDAEAALTGATPYEVSELAYDVSADGDAAHIAAVARETLDEAEAFAVEYQLNPISFVARPQSGNFKGEPFFGTTGYANELLGPDDTVEPDGAAIHILSDIDKEPTLILSEAEERAPEDVLDRDEIETTRNDESARQEETLKPPTLEGVTRTPAPVTPGGVLSGSVPGAEPVSALASEAPPPPGGFISRRGRWRKSAEASRVRTEPVLTSNRAGSPLPDRQSEPFDSSQSVAAQDHVAAGGKPRYLGLMLTAALIVFLAGVAAWASVFAKDDADNPLSRFLNSVSPAPEVSAAVLDTLPKEIPVQEPEKVVTASLSQDMPLAIKAPEALARPAPDPVFDPAKAAARYAVTGIWSIPPQVPAAPGLMSLDDLYITSIDRANLSFDAVALVPGQDFLVDESILSPADPAPAGTSFALDDRGLVMPTPEGAISPDGVLVYLGRPPSVPPTVPERVEPEPEISAAQLALAAFRPRLRPTGLVENTERSNLGGLSRSELAALRPVLRPETSKQAEERDETPTARAISISYRPTMRPNDLTRAVAAARVPQAEPRKAAPAPQQVAAVAPRTVQPSIPSRSSVTKEATVKNAIRLNRINLMGVYGTPNNRRALIRLSNGRYKKVKVGDRIDGGRVSAIGEGELRYRKGSRDVILTMPRT